MLLGISPAYISLDEWVYCFKALLYFQIGRAPGFITRSISLADANRERGDVSTSLYGVAKSSELSATAKFKKNGPLRAFSFWISCWSSC